MSEVATTGLQALMSHIGSVYAFVPEKYPDLRAITGWPGRCHFAVRHTALHMAKSTALVATQAEAADHGGKIDLDALRVAAAKQVINALNLAHVLEISAEQLIETINEELK